MFFWTLNLMNEMERMRRELDRIVGSSETPPYSRFSFLPATAARIYPLINIAEDGDNYYVDALAPGVDPDSLEISIAENQLSISGEKKSLPAGIKPEAFHRNERATGRFLRTAMLTADVDTDKITADYSDGILKITLPKTQTVRTKKIKVNVS